MDIMYEHVVQYYETDKMGITHHSNYIRWMEEARVYFLAQIGWDYVKLERLGIISPVVAVECKYKTPSTFSDVIRISVKVKEFKGVKLKLCYIMINQNNKVICEGQSEHCFINEKGLPIRLNKEFPQFYRALTELVEEECR